jgi:hypothetical protein
MLSPPTTAENTMTEHPMGIAAPPPAPSGVDTARKNDALQPSPTA